MDRPVVELRRITRAEVDDLLRLWREAGPPHKPRGRDSPESLRRQMEEFPWGFIGAYDGDRLVGAVIATFDGRKGWINRLAVHPEYRRRGIASTLVREAERVLRERGARVISALIERWNQPSLNLFRKLGYQVAESIVYVRKADDPDA